MHRLLACLLLLGALSGCMSLGDDESHQGMLLDSEACRFASTAELSSRAQSNNETSRDRDKLFENSYRKCMAAKGYDLPPEGASTGLE
jgi:hypothetical protein